MAETLGDRIRMHRARLRLSQSDLGRKVGLSTNGVSLIERGVVDPRASVIHAMADVLGVSIDYLLKGDPATKPQRRRSAVPVG
jgi:XRE family transcriptional regulator, fatty acid utilization regulator